MIFISSYHFFFYLNYKKIYACIFSPQFHIYTTAPYGYSPKKTIGKHGFSQGFRDTGGDNMKNLKTGIRIAIRVVGVLPLMNRTHCAPKCVNTIQDGAATTKKGRKSLPFLPGAS